MGGGSADADIATVRQIFDAAQRGDDQALIEHLDPEVVWRPTGFLTGLREYHGHDGVRQWLADVKGLAERGSLVRTSPTDFHSLPGGQVLVLGTGRMEREIGAIDQELGWAWQLRDGKVIRMTNYLSQAEAREAARKSART